MQASQRDSTTRAPSSTPRLEGPSLVLAPHLRYPLRNGADILAARLAQHLSAFSDRVELLGESELSIFEAGDRVGSHRYRNRMRSKRGAALRTLLKGSHFYLEKFVTPNFKRRAGELIRTGAYARILYSYITTTSATDGLQPSELPPVRLVFTHNDEFKWFRDLAATVDSAAGRRAAANSERWLHRFFRTNREDYVFAHVTEEDRDGFETLYPDHRSVVIPIGVEVPTAANPSRPADVRLVKLLFVGSLGVRMNRDALTHFAEHFYPTIRKSREIDVEVHVAGSSPSNEVASLCSTHGWHLHPDVPDDELIELIENATFTLLPFDYATGAKLKLLKSLAHGVPFLATEKVLAQRSASVHPSLIADAPGAWLERMEAVSRTGIGDEERKILVDVARENSWDASARRLAHFLAGSDRGRRRDVDPGL